MSRVILDGIEYCPFVDFESINEQMILDCIKELVSIQYFNIKHKNRAVAWDALHALSPNLAKLSSDDTSAAYEVMHGSSDCFDKPANEYGDNGNKNYIPKVFIDDIEYIPLFKSQKIKDQNIKNCLSELVSLQYFNEEHKNRAVAWNALNFLNPEIAELCSDNVEKAFNLVKDDD